MSVAGHDRPPLGVLSFDGAAPLARRIDAPIVARDSDAVTVVGYDATHDRLTIVHDGRPIIAGFERGAVGRRSLLLRAIGVPRRVTRVVDATAGLGRDAFALAAAGCRVTMIERSPVLGIALEDALRCLRRDEPDFAARLDLVCADAASALRDLPQSEPPEAIYFDPMFPDRSKRALPSHEMQMLRALLGEDALDSDLVVLARGIATRRVVVKRHPKAPPLAGKPDAVVRGRSARFDVYRRS